MISLQPTHVTRLLAPHWPCASVIYQPSFYRHVVSISPECNRFPLCSSSTTYQGSHLPQCSHCHYVSVLETVKYIRALELLMGVKWFTTQERGRQIKLQWRFGMLHRFSPQFLHRLLYPLYPQINELWYNNGQPEPYSDHNVGTHLKAEEPAANRLN